MNIKPGFYIKLWLQNSFMAIATGLIVGYFIIGAVGFVGSSWNTLLGAAITFIIYQYVSFDLFFGTRRGEFEYKYRSDLAEKIIKKLVLKTYGWITYLRYYQDQFNAYRYAQKDICQKLLKNKNILDDQESKFYIYLKLADLEYRDDNFQTEKIMLKDAISIKQKDILANFRFAVSCELDGFVNESIEHYKLASEDSPALSKKIKEYVLSNIERIELRGPRNRPPTSGAKYQSY